MALIGADEETSHPVVRIGSSVRIRDDYGEETFRIVNREQSDPGRRAISEGSPLAAALLGHQSGDTVFVRAPHGARRVTVLSVEGTNDL